jgi:hypothetical protein
MLGVRPEAAGRAICRPFMRALTEMAITDGVANVDDNL